MNCLSKSFLFAVCLLLISCSPNRGSANSYSEKLACGATAPLLEKEAAKLNASEVSRLEKDMLIVSFGSERFVIYLDENEMLGGVDREMHDYILFFDANSDTAAGFKTILDCGSKEA